MWGKAQQAKTDEQGIPCGECHRQSDQRPDAGTPTKLSDRLSWEKIEAVWSRVFACARVRDSKM